jgi:hypothetical protein
MNFNYFVQFEQKHTQLDELYHLRHNSERQTSYLFLKAR